MQTKDLGWGSPNKHYRMEKGILSNTNLSSHIHGARKSDVKVSAGLVHSQLSFPLILLHTCALFVPIS